MRIDDTIGKVLKNKPEHRIVSIAPDATVYAALELLAKHDIGALLVCDGHQLVGILSERDYARKCALMGCSARETRVDEIMTSPVRSVTPEHTVDEALTMMTGRHFRHLPVLQGDKVVGLVSIGDLVKWVIHTQQQAIGTLESYITGGYTA